MTPQKTEQSAVRYPILTQGWEIIGLPTSTTPAEPTADPYPTPRPYGAALSAAGQADRRGRAKGCPPCGRLLGDYTAHNAIYIKNPPPGKQTPGYGPPCPCGIIAGGRVFNINTEHYAR